MGGPSTGKGAEAEMVPPAVHHPCITATALTALLAFLK
jgi:hypothetical protein